MCGMVVKFRLGHLHAMLGKLVQDLDILWFSFLLIGTLGGCT